MTKVNRTRWTFLALALLPVLATLLTGCEEYATYTPSATDLTRIVEEIPAGPTRDMIQATAVQRYVEAELLRQQAAQAQATADAAEIEHQRRVAQMTAEAQAVERARASAAEATRQALDAQQRQNEINATATAQAAQAHAQATARAAAAQATATAQVAHATATAQAAAAQGTATAQAAAAQGTATAESRVATATAQSRRATATTQAGQATATIQTYYWQQTVSAQQVTATAVARQQEQEDMELQRQRLTHPLRTFGPWVLLIASVAATGYIAWRMVTVLEIRLRALKRDERGDAPVYAAGSGRAITLFDPDRNFWAGATIIDGQVIQVYDTAPSADHQARVVAGDQAVDLVTRGPLEGQRPFTRRQRTRVARRLSSTPPRRQQGIPGLRRVHVLRNIGQASSGTGSRANGRRSDMSSQHQQQVAREVAQYWKGILATLKQRGLLDQAKRTKVYPEADAVLLEDRAIFVLDMQRLAGISREAWLNQDLWRQWRAMLQGRRVFVSDGGGLAITVARRPGRPKKRLPQTIALQEEHLVDEAYHIAVGLDVRRRERVALDLAGDHRAMLIGGYTGSGKTNLMRSIVVQLAAKHPADEVQVAIVDTKEVDFAGAFDHMPQLFQPIARDQDQAEALIERVEGERIRRKAAMARGGVSDWRKLPDPPPLLVLMIDEAADFTATSTMDTLVQIARKGRAFGVSLVVSTQYPTKRVIDAQVRANLTTAIAFPTTTATESRVIINRTEAEHLRQKGRCLSFLDGRWREVQTFFVAEETVEALLGLAEAETGTVLPPLHIELVRYAQAELDGAFIINRLYDAFKGQISRRQLLKLGQTWERRGWLTEPEDAASPRFVTGELVGLCDPPPPQEA